jgi:hypothetical protein
MTDETSQSPTTQKAEEKVYISPEELKALEAKVRSAKSEDEQKVYERVYADMQAEAQRLAAAKAEAERQARLEAEIASMKTQLEQVKTAASQTPQRKGLANTEPSPFVKDEKGRVGIPVSVLEDATRKALFK